MTFLKKHIAALLLLIFCWFFACTQLNVHKHIIDGKVYSHSHPGATKGHSHSANQLISIAILCEFASEEPDIQANISCLPPVESATKFTHTDRVPDNSLCLLDKQRGPPYFA